jgi:hypothetical protein
VSSAPFRSAWYATDLGDYRPCRYTYERYPYEAQPVLDSAAFTDAFEWYGPPGAVDDEQVARLAALDRQLGDVGLALPRDFTTFYRHGKLRFALDEVSVTCCWTNLSEVPVVRAEDPEARLVRFLCDQQYCAIWYLYLHPSRDPCVVFNHVDFEELEDPEDYAEETELVWCSPSFAAFAYRFWLENRIWLRLHGNVPEPLDEAMTAYLSHYRGVVESEPERLSP